MKKPFISMEERDTQPDALQQEARIWLARLAGGEVTRRELQAFKRWQGKSRAHEAAFDEARHQWKSMKPALGELLRARPEIAARHERMLHKSPLGRRAFLGAAVSAVVVVGVSVAHPPLGMWPAPNEWGADYRTATGEQKTFALADRVHVALNTQTTVRRETAGDEVTGMRLIGGELAIDLQGSGKVFGVTAGAGRSVAESGRFEVRNLDDKVCVTCLDGMVRVAHPAGKRTLQARQQVMYDTASVGSVSGIDAAAASAWRKGELVFRQTPLADVLNEINRYRAGRVVLMAEAVRTSPVSGRFPIAILDEALLQIQHAFDLSARSLPGGLLVLS